LSICSLIEIALGINIGKNFESSPALMEKLELNFHDEAVCNDGSPAVYYW